MKELIIIVYKISVAGLNREQSEVAIYSLIDAYTLRYDFELKDNYIIREVWIPLGEGDGQTDVKVIYPVTQSYSFTPEVNDLVAEISDKIKNDPSNGFRHQWDRLVRELKLRKINTIDE